MVRIEYQNKEAFISVTTDVRLPLLDIWEIQEDYAFGKTIDPTIQKLRDQGFQVNVLYDSVEDYLNAIEEQQQ